jgi:hypothetical protein
MLRKRPDLVAGLVGLAADPDFTEVSVLLTLYSSLTVGISRICSGSSCQKT